MSDEDLVPLAGEGDSSGFDVVLRGYDRRQVEDYIARVEVALGDVDRLQQQDAARITTLEEELSTLRLALGEAERRAAGQPDPASLVGERLATMLRLAEEEAEELIAHARSKAERSNSDRAAELERREAAVSSASEAADRTRMEAQRDAQALRDKTRDEVDEQRRAAQQEADELLQSAREEAERRRRTAEEDIAILHEQAHAEQEAQVDAARAEVEEIGRQRDAIAAQLQELRRTLSEAMKPLSPGDST